MGHHSRTSAIFWGLLLIILGLLFLLQNFDLLDVENLFHLFWPVILIAVGVKMLFDHRDKSRRISRQPSGKEDWQSSDYGTMFSEKESNVFGDIRLCFDDQTVRRFAVSNVFGDIELDYAHAKFENEAKIHISGVFGNVEVRLPREINVEFRGSCTAGSMKIFGEKHDGLFQNVHYISPEIRSELPTVKLSLAIVFGDVRIFH